MCSVFGAGKQSGIFSILRRGKPSPAVALRCALPLLAGVLTESLFKSESLSAPRNAP